MNLRLPTDVLAVLHHLQTNGFEAYLVGGAVRDLFLQKEIPTDWDFTTNATPSQIQELFTESFYENEFGTVGVDRNHLRDQFDLLKMTDANDKNQSYNQVINLDEATKIHTSLKPKNLSDSNDLAHSSGDVVEITTFRSDGSYSDFRRPDQVTWGSTLEEDLHRRDFTINALAIHVETHSIVVSKKDHVQIVEEKDIQLIDPFHGLQDLAKKKVQTVGIAHDRFQEDALRMMRAIRFAVQLDFELEEKTFLAIKKQSDLIKHVSWERIRDEFLKMMASKTPALAIKMLDECGLLSYILPEILEAKNVDQGGHHTTDVWVHSLDALASCPSSDPIVRFATLLHDIAKPRTFRRTKTTITFYNHEVIGARIAKKIAERFKLSKRDIQRIFLLVRHHMFYYQPDMTDAALRRFMRKVGLENINDILDLRIGDRLGSGSKETSWRLEEMKERMQSQLHQPFSITDLKVNGNDIMTSFSLKPGPILGKILQELFEKVLENPELNEKEKLLEVTKELLKK
jgi:tRNA nucleotidyltransferase (CCA-adding enzyme)